MKILKFLAIFFVLFYSRVNAQSDTIYIDYYGNKTRKDKAEFCRLIFPKEEFFDVKDYYLNGVLQMTGTYSSFKPPIKIGNFQYFNLNGTISMEGIYVRNEKEGIWKDYDTTGKLTSTSNFQSGKLHGDFMTYHLNGMPLRKEIHEKGEFVSGKCFDEKGEETAFFPYDQLAEFQGGKQGLMTYLNNNLTYPERARIKRIQGKVWLRFIIDEEGTVEEVKVTRSVHKLLDEEAVNVVYRMPKWIPRKIDGIPVKGYFDLPINFTLR